TSRAIRPPVCRAEPWPPTSSPVSPGRLPSRANLLRSIGCAACTRRFSLHFPKDRVTGTAVRATIRIIWEEWGTTEARIMNGLICAATLVLGLSTGADPVLPAPVPVPVPGRSIPDLPPGIGFYRPNPYDQWQYYAPDRFGRWRPRVLMVPGTDDGF